MINTAPDLGVLNRVRKLLAMTTERGCSEAEAQVAASKAAALMEEHGLEMMAVERAGGDGEGRDKTDKKSSFGAWYAQLMHVVAESCFCHCEIYKVGKSELRFVLIGRKSAVASAEILYEYLRSAVWRLSREAGVDSARLFRHGCAARVTQRVKERHDRVLREQAAEADRVQRESAARAAHPGAASASTAVALRLTDYVQLEKDLNEDFRRGVAPGTTQREREESEAKAAVKTARLRELTAKHGWDVAWWMVYQNKTLEEALALEEKKAKAVAAPETDAQRAARERREERSDEAYRRSHRREQEKEHRREEKRRAKMNHPSFRAGVSAGEHVGLDQQIRRGAAPAPRNSKRMS